MAYAVVAGHNSIIPGASGNGYQEHVVARQVKDRVIHYLRQLGETAHDCTDEVGRNKTQVWMNAANNCDRAIGKNGYIIAIHLNSSASGSGTGTEILDYQGALRALCEKVSARLSHDFAWRDRGWKDGSGIGLIEETQAPVIYIELCFINNISDITKLVRNIDMAAIGIVEEVTGKKVTSTSVQVVASKEAVKEAERDINKVSDWAKEDWEEAVDNGYFDGSRPGAPITREEAAIVVNRLRHNLLKLINK